MWQPFGAPAAERGFSRILGLKKATFRKEKPLALGALISQADLIGLAGRGTVSHGP